MKFTITQADGIPSNRVYGSSVPMGEKILLIGGCDGMGAPLGTTECLNIAADPGSQWTTLPEMPTKRASGVTFPYGHLVFVFGGICNANSPLDNIEMLDSNAQTWTPLQPLPVPMQGVSVALRGNKILVVGGVTKDMVPQSSLLCFDPARQKYQAFAPMNSPRYSSSVVYSPDRDCLYTLAGRSGRFSTNVCEVFEFRTLKWRSLPSRPSPGRIFSNWIQIDDKVYIVGGLHDDPREGFSSQVDVFDIKSETWSSGPKLNKARGDAAIAYLKNHLVIAGGYGMERDVEKSITSLLLNSNNGEDAAEMEWKDHRVMFSEAHASTSHCCLGDDKLVVFGGMHPEGLRSQVDIVQAI